MEAKPRPSSIGRFVLLDQTRQDMSLSLTILGCTLFSHVPAEDAATVDEYLVDFDIVDWSVVDHNAAHESDLKWLNGQVEKIEREEQDRQTVYLHAPLPHYGPEGQ
jgi:hypothetical protein